MPYGMAQATYPQVSVKAPSSWARRAVTRWPPAWLRPDSLPIWSCSVWGLPCRDCYQPRGGLLPRRFTLTFVLLAQPAWRFVFCCTGRPAGLRRPSRTLSGTLPCGVRTFLPLRTGLRRPEAAIIRPPALVTSVSARVPRRGSYTRRGTPSPCFPQNLDSERLSFGSTLQNLDNK